MKATWMVLLLAIISSGLAAQENFEDVGFGVELYPHLSNRRLLAHQSVLFSEIARTDSLEKANFGYGLGVFYYQRVERVGFNVGLRYLSTGYRVDDDVLPNQPANNTATFSQVYTAQLLEVPFQFNFYQNLGAKTSFYFTLGATASLHLKSQIEQTNKLDSGTVTEIVETDVKYRSVNFGMITAIGIQRRFNKFTLGLQPTFEYWLSGNIVPDESTLLNRNLYNIGLRLTGQLSTY